MSVLSIENGPEMPQTITPTLSLTWRQALGRFIGGAGSSRSAHPLAQPPPHKGQLQVRRWLGGFGKCPILCLESRNWFQRLATTNLLSESISHICSVRGSKVISHVVYRNTTRRAPKVQEAVQDSGSASSPLQPIFFQNSEFPHDAQIGYF